MYLFPIQILNQQNAHLAQQKIKLDLNHWLKKGRKMQKLHILLFRYKNITKTEKKSHNLNSVSISYKWSSTTLLHVFALTSFNPKKVSSFHLLLREFDSHTAN